MKIDQSKLRKLAYSGAAGLAMAQAVSAATVITNDLTGAAGNNTAVATNFGSNVTTNSGDFTVLDGGTPDIALTWAPVGGGGWENYDWNGNGGSIQTDGAAAMSITFSAATGVRAVITSVDFDFWSAKDGWDITWSIVGDGSTNTGDQIWTSTDGVRRETIGMNITGEAGETLTLTIQQTHGNYSGSFAIDNLAFDQVAAVPEPSSAALLGLGLGAAAMRRRRK